MSCVKCFTSSSTTGDHDNPGLTHGFRNKPLQISGPKRDQPKPNSSSYVGVRNTAQTLAKIDAVRRPESAAVRKEATLHKVELPADANTMEKPEVLSKSASASSDRGQKLGLSTDGPDKPQKQFKTVAAKIKTKQVKGVITGIGKDLRRAATTVSGTLSEKLPNPTKKKNKTQKDRDELLANDGPQKPQPRNADDIKKAYGHETDTRNVAGRTRQKMRERGEKLSAIQNRTTELEADGANFQALTQELVKKIENKKWYEI